MIMQLILSGGLVLLLAVVAMQSLTSRLLKIPVMLGLLFGIYLVWFPNHATLISQAVGIGRGADLLLYLWILLSFAGLVLGYLRAKRTDHLITQLARNIAISNAQKHGGEEKQPIPRKGK